LSRDLRQEAVLPWPQLRAALKTFFRYEGMGVSGTALLGLRFSQVFECLKRIQSESAVKA